MGWVRNKDTLPTFVVNEASHNWLFSFSDRNMQRSSIPAFHDDARFHASLDIKVTDSHFVKVEFLDLCRGVGSVEINPTVEGCDWCITVASGTWKDAVRSIYTTTLEE